MTTQRDIERLLDHWFSDGPTQVPDRVINVVADRIERQPQRPAWRLHLKEIQVNTFLRAGAAMAAIVIVAVIGFNLLPRTSNGVGGGPASPSSQPAASLTTNGASPSTPAIVCEDNLPGCAGTLLAGRHASVNFQRRKLRYRTPEGWVNSIDIDTIFKLDPQDKNASYILAWANVAIAEQTASCEPVAKAGIGGTVQNWIDFLTSHPGLSATKPVPVTIGGIKGQAVDVSVAAGWTKFCPGNPDPNVNLIAHTSEPTGQYGVTSAARLHLTILDVHGETVVIEVYGPTSPDLFAARVAVSQSVIDTFEFGCGPSFGRPCSNY